MSKLVLNHISKSFGGVHAVSDFSMEAQGDSIVSIIGPNGAGKTTIFNLISVICIWMMRNLPVVSSIKLL